MFIDDIALVKEQVAKHGLLLPVADLGGQENPIVADYGKLPNNPIGRFRGRPFESIAPGYAIFNPEKGDPPIEAMAERGVFGTIICTSTLEHCQDPFAVFEGFGRTLKPNGLLILSTVFSYRYHPIDYWRFTPECLEMLAKKAGLAVLESGFRVRALFVQNDEYNLVRSVYVTARKE